GRDAAFAGAVMRGARRAFDSCSARHRYQRAAFAAFDHVLGSGAEGEKHAVEIDAHDAAPFLVVHLQDRALATARDARVCPAFVAEAHYLQRLAEARLDLLLVADIDDLGMDLVAMPLEPLEGIGVLLGIGAPDADVGAGFSHRVGHAKANAAIAAGHK